MGFFFFTSTGNWVSAIVLKVVFIYSFEGIMLGSMSDSFHNFTFIHQYHLLPLLWLYSGQMWVWVYFASFSLTTHTHFNKTLKHVFCSQVDPISFFTSIWTTFTLGHYQYTFQIQKHSFDLSILNVISKCPFELSQLLINHRNTMPIWN